MPTIPEAADNKTDADFIKRKRNYELELMAYKVLQKEWEKTGHNCDHFYNLVSCSYNSSHNPYTRFNTEIQNFQRCGGIAAFYARISQNETLLALV